MHQFFLQMKAVLLTLNLFKINCKSEKKGGTRSKQSPPCLHRSSNKLVRVHKWSYSQTSLTKKLCLCLFNAGPAGLGCGYLEHSMGKPCNYHPHTILSNDYSTTTHPIGTLNTKTHVDIRNTCISDICNFHLQNGQLINNLENVNFS